MTSALQNDTISHLTLTANNKFLCNLSELMRSHRINEAELARQTKIPQPTLHKIISGKTADPRISTLKLLADYFNISVDILLSGDPLSTDKVDKSHVQSIPIIDWTLCTNKNAINNLTSTNWENWTVTETTAQDSYALISKPCMEPRFPKGTLFVIDPLMTAKDGDLIVVHYPDTNEAALRELSIDGPNKLLFRLDPISTSEELTSEIRILGTVIQSKFSY